MRLFVFESKINASMFFSARCTTQNFTPPKIIQKNIKSYKKR